MHDALLEEVVAPAHIVGRHFRVHATGGKTIKVFLDPLDQEKVEDKLESFAEVYRKLTHKKVTFSFGKPNTFQKAVLEYRQKH